MKSQYVEELKPGHTVKAHFLLTRKSRKDKKGGGAYTLLEFTDRSGSIDGIAWENLSADLKTVESGDFVFVEGTVNEYNERTEIMVNAITRLDDREIDPADFIAQSRENLDEVMREITAIARRIVNPHLSRLTALFLNDQPLMTKFRTAPAAKKVHHVYLGGLAVHTRDLMRLAAAIGPVYPTVDLDLLVTGAFLHDIGKIHEYEYHKKIDLTTRGRMLGHIIIGYEIVAARINEILDFPEDLRLKILHIIVSHHGELEWGSPTLPLFPEALIIHFLDNLDAKHEIMKDLLRKYKGSLRQWSDYHPLLEREIYLGDES